MATTPAFTATPRAAQALVSTANTGRDGTGTLVDVFAAGSSGSRIEHIDLAAIGTTTAGVLRLFLHDGSTSRLWKELLVTAITPSASVAVWATSINCSALSSLLLLPANWKLQASTHNAESFVVTAFGGDF